MRPVRGARCLIALTSVLALAACGSAPDPGDAQEASGDAAMDALPPADSASSDAGDAVAPSDAADAVATSDGGRQRGTGVIMGTVGGASATPMDVVFQPSPSCGGAAGVYLATSGTPVVCATPLAGELRQPYIQLRIAARTPGVYTLVPEGMCTSTTTDRVFTASFNAEGASTYDGASGMLTILASTADEIRGSFQITFGSPAAGTLMGTFTATACPAAM